MPSRPAPGAFRWELEKEFSGPLLLKALNSYKQEIGRSRQELSLEEEEAQYLEFSFPKEMDATTAESYEIRPAKAAAENSPETAI
ncbi:hypothetical protein SDC9_130026 [bioreactor metagenome]|uniref:Uncharacterized protein n=1 Tax=bioreactor metagenome TaxID=1076179 RepID=A0A645D172_9ZZZZ